MSAMNSRELQTFALYWYANSLLTFSLKCIAEFHFMKENSLIHKTFGINLINIPLISSNSIRVQSGILVLSQILLYKRTNFSGPRCHKKVITHNLLNCIAFDTGTSLNSPLVCNKGSWLTMSVPRLWSAQDKSHLSKTNCPVTFESSDKNIFTVKLVFLKNEIIIVLFLQEKHLLAWICKVLNNCRPNPLTAARAKISSILWKVGNCELSTLG